MRGGGALVELDEVRHSGAWRAWGALAAERPPFLSPEVFAAMQPLVPGRPYVAEAWSDGDLIGALPLTLSGRTLFGLWSMYSPGYDYCGSDLGLELIWKCLHRSRCWNRIQCTGVPEGSMLATRFLELARADDQVVVRHAAGRHPYVPLDHVTATVGAAVRGDLERMTRIARELELERIAVPTTADLDDALRIQGGLDPRAGHFYQVLGRVLGRRGAASLYFLRVGGERVAALFALEDHRTLFVLALASRDEYAQNNPGDLLLWHAGLEARRRGLRELEIDVPDERRPPWIAGSHPTVTITIYRPTMRGLALYAMNEWFPPALFAPLW